MEATQHRTYPIPKEWACTQFREAVQSQEYVWLLPLGTGMDGNRSLAHNGSLIFQECGQGAGWTPDLPERQGRHLSPPSAQAVVGRAICACADAKIKNFIYTSSHTVYDSSHYLPIDENHPLNPTTNYSLSKLINENFCELFSEHDINFTILRISSVYGNDQKERFVIPTLINSCILQDDLVVHKYKNGFQIMDFVHVDDVCSSIELACNSKQKFGIYNIASGKPVTAFQIAKYLKGLSGTNSIKIKKIQKNTNHFIYDISKAKRELKFKPKIWVSKKILKSLLSNFENRLS